MADIKMRVLFTDNVYGDISREAAVLSAAGFEVVDARCHTAQELLPHLPEAVGIINQHLYLSKETLSVGKALNVIVRQGVGYDTIDLEGASDLGITVCNVPDYGPEDVASHAFALMLSSVRRIPRMDAAIKRGEWSYEMMVPAPDLMESTVGIVGLGRIGSAFARKAIGFGFRVMACDPYISGTDLDVELVDFNTLLAASDFITIHTPLTDETRNMFGSEQFEAMKTTAHLINAARGPIVDLDALTEALQKEKIAGAAIDVTEPEPLMSDHPICDLDTVIISPHAAWYSEGSIVRLRDRTAQTALTALSGTQPPNIVNEAMLKAKGNWPW